MTNYDENYPIEQDVYDRLAMAMIYSKGAREMAHAIMRGRARGWSDTAIQVERERLEEEVTKLIAVADKLQRILDLPRPM